MAYKARVAFRTDKAIFFYQATFYKNHAVIDGNEVMQTVGTTCTIVPFIEEANTIFELDGRVIAINGTKMRVLYERMSVADQELLEDALKGVNHIVKRVKSDDPRKPAIVKAIRAKAGAPCSKVTNVLANDSMAQGDVLVKIPGERRFDNKGTFEVEIP